MMIYVCGEEDGVRGVECMLILRMDVRLTHSVELTVAGLSCNIHEVRDMAG